MSTLDLVYDRDNMPSSKQFLSARAPVPSDLIESSQVASKSGPRSQESDAPLTQAEAALQRSCALVRSANTVPPDSSRGEDPSEDSDSSEAGGIKLPQARTPRTQSSNSRLGVATRASSARDAARTPAGDEDAGEEEDAEEDDDDEADPEESERGSGHNEEEDDEEAEKDGEGEDDDEVEDMEEDDEGDDLNENGKPYPAGEGPKVQKARELYSQAVQAHVSRVEDERESTKTANYWYQRMRMGGLMPLVIGIARYNVRNDKVYRNDHDNALLTVFGSIFSTTDPRLMVSLACGNLSKDKVYDKGLRQELARIDRLARLHNFPGVYHQQLVDDNGNSPTPKELRRAAITAKAYAGLDGLSMRNTEARKIDVWINEWKRAPLKPIHNEFWLNEPSRRRYLSSEKAGYQDTFKTGRIDFLEGTGYSAHVAR